MSKGRRVLLCDQTGIQIVETREGRKEAAAAMPLREAAFAGENGKSVVGILPNNRTANQAEDVLLKLDAASLMITGAVTNRFLLSAMVVSPDGSTVVTGGREQMLEIFDVSTLERRLKFRAHDQEVSALTHHPGRPILVSGGENGRVKFWDAHDGVLLKELWAIGGRILSMAFSPSGNLLVVTGADKSMRLFDVSDL